MNNKKKQKKKGVVKQNKGQHSSKHINKFVVLETLEGLLSQIGYYYDPVKSNQIMIKKFFHCIPFFFFDYPTQNTLYIIIQNYHIENYYDTTENMKTLCYKIYSDLCIKYNVVPKTRELFYDNLEIKLHSEKEYIKKTRQKHIHSIIFISILVSISLLYIYTQKNYNPNV